MFYSVETTESLFDMSKLYFADSLIANVVNKRQFVAVTIICAICMTELAPALYRRRAEIVSNIWDNCLQYCIILPQMIGSFQGNVPTLISN